MNCSRHHSQHMYNASAYSVSAEFERPKKHSMAPQASVVLAGHGGHGSNSAPAYKADGLISFKNAYSEVGGSFDDCHGLHTTHAWSVVEGLNVADMLTADRVVARMAVYHSSHGSEATYDITGSYFENLRIAGYPINVELATDVFHDITYSNLAKAHQAGTTDQWLVGSKLKQLHKEGKLENLENEYHALKGMSNVVNEWNEPERPEDRGSYWFSPANELDWEKQKVSSEIQCFGSIICIPKFGVIRLAEMLVHRHSRTLRMFRVQMCSSGHGTSDGGTTTGGGTGGTAPPG